MNAEPPPTTSSQLPASCLISTFPLVSGHGTAVRLLRDLHLFETDAFYKFRLRDPEQGYSRVVRAGTVPGASSLLLSLYLPNRWSRDIRRFRCVHIASPHLFHLARYNRNSTGIVHDLIQLSEPGAKVRARGPGTRVGYRFLISRAVRNAHKLRGVVSVSRVTDEALHALNPHVRSRVIHHWTGDEIRYRDRDESRVRLGLPLDRTILLHASVDAPHKNLDLLPRLAERLDPSFLVLRIGDSRRVEHRFRAGQLRWLRSVPSELYPLYLNAADAVLVPSVAEGFGFPVIEAVNSATPVVASDIPVFREILGREYPYLVDPRDAREWMRTCVEVTALARDVAARQRLFGRLGDYYRIPRARREYVSFFRELGAPVDA